MLKTKTPRHSLADLLEISAELVQNARLLHPDLPAGNLVPKILAMAEEDFLAELDMTLRTGHFLKVARALAATARREEREQQWLSPQIREYVLTLPLRIRLKDRIIDRRDLRYPDLGEYIKACNQGDRDKHLSNARIQAAKKLRQSWPTKQRNSRATLADVDQLKAQRAGLI